MKKRKLYTKLKQPKTKNVTKLKRELTMYDPRPFPVLSLPPSPPISIACPFASFLSIYTNDRPNLMIGHLFSRFNMYLVIYIPLDRLNLSMDGRMVLKG